MEGGPVEPRAGGREVLTRGSQKFFQENYIYFNMGYIGLAVLFVPLFTVSTFLLLGLSDFGV